MSGTPLLIIAAAALREQEEKREKERLEQLAKQTAQEKTTYLACKAANWKTDEDIVAAFDDVLNGNYSFNSVQTAEIKEISIKDFFAFLTQYKEKKEIVRIIQENELFKRMLERHPYSLFSFIKATSHRNSVIGRGKDGYTVERDIYQNRQQIFQRYCPEQRKPRCAKKCSLNAIDTSLSHFYFEKFLENLHENTHPVLKKALAEDIVVPATLIASGDKKLEKMYRKFLEQKEILYDMDKKEIALTFEKARQASETPEYQDLFIAPCPAIKIKRLWGIFPVSCIDESQKYECPVMKKVLERQNSR